MIEVVNRKVEICFTEHMQAEQLGIPRVLTSEELLTDEAVELVVNLTGPAATHAVSRATIAAGKHVWSEKPLAVERAEGRSWCVPRRPPGCSGAACRATFLGGGHQTQLRRAGRPSTGARYLRQRAAKDRWRYPINGASGSGSPEPRSQWEWEQVPLNHGHTELRSGLGVDLASAVRRARPQRADGELALHMPDVMHAITEAAGGDRLVELAS